MAPESCSDAIFELLSLSATVLSVYIAKKKWVLFMLFTAGVELLDPGCTFSSSSANIGKSV